MKLYETLKYSWISLALLLVCASHQVTAQNRPVPSAAKPQTVEETPEIPKEKPSFKPTGLRLGTNLFRLGRTAFADDYSSWDIAGDIDFYRYLLDVSYGRETIMEFTDAYEYETSGSFFRIGVDVNFIKDRSDANALLFGVKYVTGNYGESFSFLDANNLTYRLNRFDLSNESLRSRWLELNGGLKVRIWQQLYAGFYFRYRLNRVLKGDREFGTYRVPGYGTAERRNVLGFDYYIFWRIPFKKSPKILTEGFN